MFFWGFGCRNAACWEQFDDFFLDLDVGTKDVGDNSVWNADPSVELTSLRICFENLQLSLARWNYIFQRPANHSLALRAAPKSSKLLNIPLFEFANTMPQTKAEKVSVSLSHAWRCLATEKRPQKHHENRPLFKNFGPLESCRVLVHFKHEIHAYP